MEIACTLIECLKRVDVVFPLRPLTEGKPLYSLAAVDTTPHSRFDSKFIRSKVAI